MLPDATTPGKFVLAYLSQYALTRIDSEEIQTEVETRTSVKVRDIIEDLYKIQLNTSHDGFWLTGDINRDIGNKHLYAAFADLEPMGFISVTGDKNTPISLEDKVSITPIGRMFGEDLRLPGNVEKYLEKRFEDKMDISAFYALSEANNKLHSSFRNY
ncbi:MAG: hypothetical protein Q8O89_02050 [Nanoarchaeota archaeon]|nr:hypothetical protein [Nanoarchaeota archaeon]